MKRGFLITQKAKRSPLRSAPKHKPEAQPPPPNPGIVLPFGKLDLSDPLHYKANPKIVETPGDSSEAPEMSFNFTTLPPSKVSSTYADFPEGSTQCWFYGPGPKRLALSIPGFPHPLPKPPQPRHRIGPSPIPGGGLAMFATCDIKAKEVILAERPLLIAPSSPPLGIKGHEKMTQVQKIRAMLMEAEKLMEYAVGRMFEENKAKYLALANSHTEDGSGPLHGVLRTNGFALSMVPGGGVDKNPRHSGVFDEISRINHSCDPNAAPHFHVESFSSKLVAKRDIKKGEEIVVSYCNILACLEVRKKQLAPYGFVCTCPRCTFESRIVDPVHSSSCTHHRSQ